LYAKCVTIILSNFEGDESETFSSLDTKLEARFLTNILDNIMMDHGLNTIRGLQQYLNKSKDVNFGEEITRMLDVLTIFKKMEEKVPEGNLISRYKDYRGMEEFPERTKVLEYLEGRLLKIEITNEVGHNQILYFPNHPVFSSLSSQLRDAVMY
jgi:hypothetical protein